MKEIFRDAPLHSMEQLRDTLETLGLHLSQPIGFNNTYGIGMLAERARDLGLEKVSQLSEFVELKYGFSNEFMERGDGWPGLKSTYGLNPDEVQGLQHDLAYRALESGSIDVIDVYTTDPEIPRYEILVLLDDKNYFPEYQAVLLYRAEIEDQIAPVKRVMESALNESEMAALNAKVKVDGKSEIAVARQFLGLSKRESSIWDQAFARIAQRTLEHLYMVAISLALAIAIAIPLGILTYRVSQSAGPVLSAVGILQTIPSLALLVFMIPLFGIGYQPAIAALFVYSLLPIVRNTHSGLTNIDKGLLESAEAMGLPSGLILRQIELPLAGPSILAGIKTAAVINVGTATLGALIGAGGYGQPILSGIRLDDIGLILEGAIPAAVLALFVQAVFDAFERSWLKHLNR